MKTDVNESEEIIVRPSKKFTPEEINLQKVLQSPECLDEAAMTINFLTRRLLCDMFDLPLFRDLIKTKIEMKLKELAVSYRQEDIVVFFYENEFLGFCFGKSSCGFN